MRVPLLPKTDGGKYSIAAIILFFILYNIRRLIFMSSFRPIGKTFFDPPIVGILMVGAWFFGCIAFLTGILSIFKRKEHSILVFLSMLFGFFIFLFGVGEVLFPH